MFECDISIAFIIFEVINNDDSILFRVSDNKYNIVTYKDQKYNCFINICKLSI